MQRTSVAGFHRRICCTAVLAILVAALAADAQADTKLRWQFKPGEKLGYELNMDMTQNMNIADMAIKVTMVQRMGMTWDVKEVADDGTATMTQTMDRIRMDMNPGGGQKPIQYDSQNERQAEGAEMLAPIFDAMVGKPMTMKITPQGEIKDLKISPEMLAGLKGSAMPQLSSMFSEEGMKQMISRGMLSFPAEPVTVGKTWDSTAEMSNPILGKQILGFHYEYAGQEKRDGRTLDKIAPSFTIKFEPSPDAQAQVNVKDQSTKGAIYFDNAAGRLVESNVTSTMNLEISVGGMSIAQEVTTLVVMKQAAPTAAKP